MFIQYLWLFRKKLEGDTKRLAALLTLVFSLLGLLTLFRILNSIAPHAGTQDFMHAGSAHALFLLFYLLLLLLLAFSIGLLVNKRLFATLAFREETFSKAFQSSPYALVLSRMSDALIVEVNHSYETMTGYTAEQTIGRKSTEMQLWAECEKRAAVVSRIEQTGQIRDEEMMFRRKNGELFPGLFSAQTIPMDNETYMLSSIVDITARKTAQQEREELIAKLQKALSEVKTLSGLLPICAACKKVRDDKGYWRQIEASIREHSDARFSHSLCPECVEKLYPEYADKVNPSSSEKRS